MSGPSKNKKIAEATMAMYYVQWHAKEARYQYLKPDFYAKIRHVLDCLAELDDLLECEEGVRGMRLRAKTLQEVFREEREKEKDNA